MARDGEDMQNVFFVKIDTVVVLRRMEIGVSQGNFEVWSFNRKVNVLCGHPTVRGCSRTCLMSVPFKDALQFKVFPMLRADTVTKDLLFVLRRDLTSRLVFLRLFLFEFQVGGSLLATNNG